MPGCVGAWSRSQLRPAASFAGCTLGVADTGLGRVCSCCMLLVANSRARVVFAALLDVGMAVTFIPQSGKWKSLY